MVIEFILLLFLLGPMRIPTQSYLFDCLIKGLLLLLLLLLFACIELLLLSVTDLVGGCGGGPRFLVFISPPPLDVEFDALGFICFFIIKCRDSSVLKSTAVPLFKLLVVLVFCGLFPVDDADDSDSFVVGDVTPIAYQKKKKKKKKQTPTKMINLEIFQLNVKVINHRQSMPILTSSTDWF